MRWKELLKAVYRSIAWERLYELAPGASREEVDELFQRLRELLQRGAEPQAEPVPEKARLHCDGASSGNPGPAGIGMVLSAPDGREVLSWGEFIGRATNNVAEYTALVAGLERALELGVRSIEVLSDSELLVRQVEGRYKVKNAALKQLHSRATELLSRFEESTVRHSGREQNQEADRLAKQQIKKANKKNA